MKFCILLTVLALVGIFYTQVEAEENLIDCENNRNNSGDYCKGLGLDAEPCKIHKRMTPEEVQEIFQATHNAVPDYEVVQFDVSRLVKRGARSARALRFNAFGGNMRLWVQPAEGVIAGKNTPVIIAKKHRQGPTIYEDYPYAMRNVGRLLEDPINRASFVVRRDSRGLYSINGHIASKNLVVRSLPESISNELIKNRKSENLASTKSKTTRSAYHVVFKTKVKPIKDSKKTVEGVNKTRTRLSRSPVAVPAVVYPEIMVVVDSSILKLNGNDIDKVLAYVVTFWNGVDLLYRGFEQPKFRFNIARVIIADEPKAVRYISDNMFNENIFNGINALDAATYYYYAVRDRFTDESYDAVVTLTSLLMSQTPSYKSDMFGVSLNGAACVVEEGKKKVMKVALITDEGSYDGVSTAAHEFAHLLDANHDDKDCKEKWEGYIMAEASGDITEHFQDFSECTVAEIQTWLANNKGTCLYNVPITTNPLPRTLPGQLRDRDHQCNILKKGNNCYNEGKNQLPCTAIYCKDPTKSQSCVEVKDHAPVDGAFCSRGKVCLHGKCVSI